MNKILENKPRLIFWSLFVLLLLFAIFAATNYHFTQSNDDNKIVARVGSQTVTKSEYLKEIDQCQSGYKDKESERLFQDCEKSALDELIMLAGLREEAMKYNINVSDKIEEEYRDLISLYDSEQVMLTTYLEAFKMEPDDIKRNLERDILKNELSDKLISKIHVLKVFVRWDNWAGEEGAEKSKQNALQIANKYLLKPMNNNFSKEELETVLEKLREENPKYDNSAKTYVGINEIFDLNENNYKDYFILDNKTDWEKISVLKNIGDNTDAFISPGGDAAIWRLVGKNNGRYQSWEDYLSSLKDKSRLEILNNNIKNGLARLKDYKIINKAEASCTAHMVGYIVKEIRYRGTTIRVPGVKVSWSENRDFVNSSPDDPPGCTAHCTSASCSGSLTYTTDRFTIGGGDRDNLFNCNARWNITFSSPTDLFYQTRYYDRSFKDNSTNLNIDYDLANVNAWAEYDTSSGTITVDSNTNELGNNNGIIFVQRKNTPKTLTITKAGNGSGTVTSSPTGISCGSTCSKSYAHGTSVTLTATPSTGSNFTGWSGSGCSGTGTCTVSMTENRSVTANFTLKTYNITYEENTSATVSNMPSNGTVNYGLNYTIPNNRPTRTDGYNFIAWRTSCTSDTVCSGSSYQPGNTITNVTSNKTLYAQWNALPTADATQTQFESTTAAGPVTEVGVIPNNGGSLNITKEFTHVRLNLTVRDADGDRVRVVGASYRRSDVATWSECEGQSSFSNQPRDYYCRTGNNLTPGTYYWSYEVEDEKLARRIYITPDNNNVSFKINGPTCGITDPGRINEGEDVDVEYTTNQAWKAEVDNGIGLVNIISGDFNTGELQNTRTYTMTVTGSGYSTNTCELQVKVKKLSCQVSPQTGPASLVTLTNTSQEWLDDIGNFTYIYRDGTSDTGPLLRLFETSRLSLSHTFDSAGTYSVWVRHPEYFSGREILCSPVIIVTDPSGGSGGEVAP